MRQKLEKPYISGTLPVLSRQTEQDSIVVTSEMVVSFEPRVSKAEAINTLERYDLKIIRPLQFSENRYLVSAPNLTGQAVFAAANQLGDVSTVLSATPNFV